MSGGRQPFLKKAKLKDEFTLTILSVLHGTEAKKWLWLTTPYKQK